MYPVYRSEGPEVSGVDMLPPLSRGALWSRYLKWTRMKRVSTVYTTIIGTGRDSSGALRLSLSTVKPFVSLSEGRVGDYIPYPRPLPPSSTPHESPVLAGRTALVRDRLRRGLPRPTGARSNFVGGLPTTGGLYVSIEWVGTTPMTRVGSTTGIYEPDESTRDLRGLTPDFRSPVTPVLTYVGGETYLPYN